MFKRLGFNPKLHGSQLNYFYSRLKFFVPVLDGFVSGKFECPRLV